MPDLRKMRAGRRSRVPRPLMPTGIQLRYYAELKSMVGYARALVEARLVPLLPELYARAATQRGEKRDAADPGRRVNRLMDRVSERFYRVYNHERLEKLTRRIAAATSEHQKGQLFRQVKAAMGVELSTIADRKVGPAIRQFTAENVSLIKSVPQTYLDDVEKVVVRGMNAGARHETIAGELQERLGVAESKAKLIARDQTLKFYGNLNRVRQTELGVESYVWRASPDSRTREEHEERDGETFRWDDPPGDPSDPAIGGHPGEAINCRCFAEPVLGPLTEEPDSPGIEE